jgi:hypothetical protein
MDVQLLFGISVAFGFVAWAVVTVFYIWPELRDRSRIEALRPLFHGDRLAALATHRGSRQHAWRSPRRSGDPKRSDFP